MPSSQICPTLLRQAKRKWTPYGKWQYVKFSQLRENSEEELLFDSCESQGVAVFSRDTLTAIGYMPINRNFYDCHRFFYEESNQTCLVSNMYTMPAMWIEAESRQEIDMQYIWSLFSQRSRIQFHNRLALLRAHEFEFIQELPEGYVERDLSTRYPVPGRLIPKRLVDLLHNEDIKVGTTLHIAERRIYKTLAPERTAVVVGVYCADPFEERTNVYGSYCSYIDEIFWDGCDLGVIVQFPSGDHRSIPADFLQFRNRRLFCSSIKENEWTISQYDDAYKTGRVW